MRLIEMTMVAEGDDGNCTEKTRISDGYQENGNSNNNIINNNNNNNNNNISIINNNNNNLNGRFRRVCVFCGSSSGNKGVFGDAALDLGNHLVKCRVNVVYGGGSVGLMGLLAQTVFDGGCHVLGVIPKALMPREISGQSIGEVKVVSDMHERKAEMARQADAFIALPGGYGTLEELLEMITWSQLGIHDKPVGLLNVDGYYDALLALFDKGVEEGFIKPSARHIVVSAPNAHDLLCRMEEYVPVHDCVATKQSWEMEELNSL